MLLERLVLPARQVPLVPTEPMARTVLLVPLVLLVLKAKAVARVRPEPQARQVPLVRRV